MINTELSKTKVGVDVECAICGKRKKPVGRSAPVELYMCNSECKGYYEDPHVGSLWPNESEYDFGYPVGIIGTREIL